MNSYWEFWRNNWIVRKMDYFNLIDQSSIIPSTAKQYSRSLKEFALLLLISKYSVNHMGNFRPMWDLVFRNNIGLGSEQ